MLGALDLSVLRAFRTCGHTPARERLYLGLHYPSDVLAGVALRSAFGELAS